MKTTVYIPFTDFTINNKRGELQVFESLVQNGPAYRLIVHESPEWFKIRESLSNEKAIEILPREQEEEFTEKAKAFFLPVIEDVGSFFCWKGDNRLIPSENLTSDLRRALSYILIAHDYKARIYEDEILCDSLREIDIIKNSQENVAFSKESLKRIEAFKKLILAYEARSIDSLSVNEDTRIFHDFMDLLDNAEVKRLSEKNYLFGILEINKEKLVRDIREVITGIAKSKPLPYVLTVPSSILIYYITRSLDPLKGIVADVALDWALNYFCDRIKGLDLREYAPPIQRPNLFNYGKRVVNSLSYELFNCIAKIIVSTP